MRAAAHVIRSPLRISAGQGPGDILTFLDGDRKFFLILLLQCYGGPRLQCCNPFGYLRTFGLPYFGSLYFRLDRKCHHVGNCRLFGSPYSPTQSLPLVSQVKQKLSWIFTSCCTPNGANCCDALYVDVSFSMCYGIFSG